MSTTTILIRTLFSVALIGCIRTKSQESSIQNDSTPPSRYQGDLPLGETITLDSPRTPLVEAIRATVIDEYKYREGNPPQPSETPSLPDTVKKAILDVLGKQAKVDSVFSKVRPCRIHPDLITPGEIIYSLQRARLGMIGVDDSMEPSRFRNRSWASALGYQSDILYLMNAMESWFKELEGQVGNSLPQMVADSLGLKLVNLSPLIEPNDHKWNLIGGFNFRDYNNSFVTPNRDLRCFVMGQIHYLNRDMIEYISDKNFVNNLESLKVVDYYSDRNTPEKVSQIIESSNTVVELNTYSGSTPIFNPSGIINYQNICDFQIDTINKISESARRKIKKISLTNIFVNQKNNSLKYLSWLDRNLLPRSMITALRKGFPNAKEYRIKGELSESYLDANFIRGLIEEGAKHGIKFELFLRSGAAYPSELKRHQKFLEDFQNLPPTKGVESIVFYPGGLAPDVSKILAVLPDLRRMRIVSKSLKNSLLDFSKSRPHKLIYLTLSGCKDGIDPITLSFPQPQFPDLKAVTLDSKCKKSIRLESSPNLFKVIRQLKPEELFEIVQSYTDGGK